METKFQKFLEMSDLAERTVVSYVKTVNNFIMYYGIINKENLLAYKDWLIKHFKPRTVNLRLHAMNKFLEFTRKDYLRLKFVKIQNKNSIENVISNDDYEFLKSRLKRDELIDWYFIIWFLAATGARISELIHIKVEHVEIGYMDIYTKGGKNRRIYIPKTLRKEARKWLAREKMLHGYIFKNRYGEQTTTRGIARQMKQFAVRYGLNPKVIYPHSFRHRFAKNFLNKFNDISLLADLMGHESIETTRIYLRRTINEQQKIVDMVVTW
jgi:site-specific recombinase XerD